MSFLGPKSLGQAQTMAMHAMLFGAHYYLQQQDIYQGKPG